MKKALALLLTAATFSACTTKLSLPSDWREQNMINVPNETFYAAIPNIDPHQDWSVASMNPKSWAQGVTVTEIPGTAPTDTTSSQAPVRQTRGFMSDLAKALAGGGSSSSNYGSQTAQTSENTTTSQKVADFFSIQEGKSIELAFKQINGWAKMTVGVYYYETDGSIVKVPVYGPIVGKNYSAKSQPSLNNKSVSLTQGTCFGLYIEAHTGPDIDKKTYPTNDDYIWYSESRLNSDGMGHVMLVTETTTTTTGKGTSAKTTTSVKQYLAFEDTDASKADMDYDDFILTVNTPIEEGEIPIYALECDGGPWMVLCEDLGNGADNDFNDVIFVVRRPKADQVVVEFVAGGSTIQDHVLFNNSIIGEIHNKFGVDITQVDEQNKPDWFINTKVYNGRPSKSEATWAKSVSSDPIRVNPGLTMANFYRTNPNNFEEGFSVKNFNTEVPFSPTYKGYAPYMICVPANGFRWPQETKSIFDAYPEFAGWAQDHTKNTEWYLHPDTTLVVDLDAMLELVDE